MPWVRRAEQFQRRIGGFDEGTGDTQTKQGYSSAIQDGMEVLIDYGTHRYGTLILWNEECVTNKIHYYYHYYYYYYYYVSGDWRGDRRD